MPRYQFPVIFDSMLPLHCGSCQIADLRRHCAHRADRRVRCGRFLDESRCHLAVSLHNPFPDERLSMMPVENAYPIEDVLELIRQYDFTGQRRVSFEYTMFAGFNDTKRHADALSRMLAGLECRVNLIRFHKIPDFPYGPSSQGVMELFRDRLSRAGITTTIRASRGEDILAACGMLAGRHKDKSV